MGQLFDRLPDQVQRWHWVNYELRHGEPELRLVRDLLGPSGILVDVGANTGIYSALALRYGRMVVAFEPVPEEAAKLRRMIGSRGTVHEVALSESPGEATLHIPVRGGTQITTRSSLEEDIEGDTDYRPLQVKVATLDSFSMTDQIALLKIDVEGHEMAVLRGAAATLSRCRPNVLIEAEDSRQPGSVGGVRTFFEEMGYSGSWLDESRVLRPIDEFDLATHQAHRPQWGDSRGFYVNNFIWRPA